MQTAHKPLPHHTISRDAKLNRRTTNRPVSISLDDSALVVMTDLEDITPFSIEPTAGIEATNDKMIACGVRLLFVTDSDGILHGLVTSTDVFGEKPVKYMSEHGGKRSEILCQDIMTPRDKLDVIHMVDVERATVGDVVETMKIFQRQHILVTERIEGSTVDTIRGIFSTTQISRQLGYNIELGGARATTFAELEHALVASG